MPGATRDDIMGHLGMQPGREGAEAVGRMLRQQQLSHRGGAAGIDFDNEGKLNTAFYTIQRVNASAMGEDEPGPGGGGDAGDGGHRHSLEESDRVKKNSVIRANLKGEKQRRKSSVQIQVCVVFVMFLFLTFWLCVVHDRRGLRTSVDVDEVIRPHYYMACVLDTTTLSLRHLLFISSAFPAPIPAWHCRDPPLYLTFCRILQPQHVVQWTRR
ncbi:MAG: hypothetical protein INR71_03475 [Terriglobus roseus]|nr:hypothetical protein [Terriglobus roseus]